MDSGALRLSRPGAALSAALLARLASSSSRPGRSSAPRSMATRSVILRLNGRGAARRARATMTPSTQSAYM